MKRQLRNNSGPSEKVEKGSRGHLDISVWDPDQTDRRYFRKSGGVGEQRTIAAVEMRLNEHHGRFQWHVYWDLLKLTDPENEIEMGIVLFFVRDYLYTSKFPSDGFLKKLNEMFGSETSAHIIYAESSSRNKSVWMISDTLFRDYRHYQPQV